MKVIEKHHIAILLSIIIIIFLLTGKWVIAVLLATIGYLSWVLYKVTQLQLWLKNGADKKHIPDSRGIWEDIIIKILTIKKVNDDRKKLIKTLLKRFKNIVKNLPYAIILLNNNRIEWNNKIATNLLGINKKDKGILIINLIRELNFVNLINKNKNNTIEFDSPITSEIKLVAQAINIHSELKLIIVRDISERIHLNEMRNSFISNASHELRTPLTVISGYLEIMKNSKELPNSLTKAVSTSYKKAEKINDIITELLALSKLESTNLIKKNNSDIDVSKIINSICLEYKEITNKNDINVTSDPKLMLIGCEDEIESLCNNLIYNAIFHNKANTKIEIKWQILADKKALFSVKDYGIGIDEINIKHLTERFYQVNKSKEGSGLGLAISKYIAKRHNASLQIESKVDSGSCFTVIFPKERVKLIT